MPRELEGLNSAYGTEEQLRHCVATLKAAGVLAIADCVLNHRCAGKQVLSGTASACAGLAGQLAQAKGQSCACAGW